MIMNDEKSGKPAIGQPCYDGVFTVIGTDTYLGSHLEKHLKDKYESVYGFRQDEDFDIDIKNLTPAEFEALADEIPTALADWIFICLDPSIGFEKYTEKLRKICDTLAEKDYTGDLCLISSGALCIPETDCPITESSVVCPRNERDLALATGENFMNVLAHKSNSYIIPHIMRIGVPYGNETPNNISDGFVNQMIATAKAKNDLQVPLGGDAKRSLTHISDICDATIALVNAEYCPSLVNIPGEDVSINETGNAVAKKFQVSFEECGLCGGDEPNYFAGDQHLSAEVFNESVNFTPRYTFKRWLADQ